jgi:hypothetical protein
MSRPAWLYIGARVRFADVAGAKVYVVKDLNDGLHHATLDGGRSGTVVARYAVLESANARPLSEPSEPAPVGDLVTALRSARAAIAADCHIPPIDVPMQSVVTLAGSILISSAITGADQ